MIMAAVEDNQRTLEEERETEDNTLITMATNATFTSTATTTNNNDVISSLMSRKEKRKALKKMKRKQVRREIAIKVKQEEEVRLNDPDEQIKLLKLEQEEAERMLRNRLEYEERERQFLLALELKKRQNEEQEERQKLLQEDSRNDVVNNDADEDNDWEYIEEGPAEIIWKGNEIIVKKKTVRVPKKLPVAQKEKQESERPISNPLAPQSEAYEEYRSAQEVLENVAQQVPNFGTEQDKAHCPFHLKTGVCRFGARCSRVHFYPDKACTILIKNMYNGPGLAWEQDEGLEHTDEEVQQYFEDFYEDVHTEFLKFGEIVNFKVCRNGSSHLRGNVYVHYKSMESAMLAYESINGRYFAGKMLTCEFVNLTRWRVAICGEYMKSRLKTCSRGSLCNFIHCFRNPGGDYEWADWDKPAPGYWMKKMAALFGYTSDGYTGEVSPGFHSRSSRSRGLDSPYRKNYSDEDFGRKRKQYKRHKSDGREASKLDEELKEGIHIYRDYHTVKHRETYNDDMLEGHTDDNDMKRKRRREPDSKILGSRSRNVGSLSAKDESAEGGALDRYMEYRSRSSSSQKRSADSGHDHHKVKNLDHHDMLLRRKGERYLERKKEEDSSIDDSCGDSPDSNENQHGRRSRKDLRKIKYELEESGSASDKNGHVRDDKKEHKNRKERSKQKYKKNASEIKCSRNCQDTCGTGRHNCVEKSSREMKHTLGIDDGGDRLGKDKKKPHKNKRKSKRITCHSGFTDRDSDQDVLVKNDAESSSTSDGDLRSIEKRPHKSSRRHRSKKKLKTEKIRKRIDVEDRHHGHNNNGNYPCSSKDDSFRKDDEAHASDEVETCVAHSSCQDYGEAKHELEKAFRHAALMKFKEIRQNKDIQAAHSEDSKGSLTMCIRTSI